MQASGVLALYHHVKGEWTPFKGDASSKSNATLIKAKNGSYSIKVVFQTTSEVRICHIIGHLPALYDKKLTFLNMVV